MQIVWFRWQVGISEYSTHMVIDWYIYQHALRSFLSRTLVFILSFCLCVDRKLRIQVLVGHCLLPVISTKLRG